MNRLKIVTVCGTALLIAAAVVVASRGRRREVPLPEVPVEVPTAEVRVKAVERKVETVESSDIDAAKFPNRKPRRTSTGFGILLPGRR